MAGIKNYYVILGVAEDASPETIHDAYRRLAKAHHPDRAGTDATPAFQEISEAYGALADARSRRRHDSALRRQRRRAPPPPRPSSPVAARRGDVEPLVPSGARLGVEQQPITVLVTAALAAEGGRVRLQVAFPRACMACGGRRPWRSRCLLCGGRGWRLQRQSMIFDLPAGLRDGERLHYRVEGVLRPAASLTLLVRVQDR